MFCIFIFGEICVSVLISASLKRRVRQEVCLFDREAHPQRLPGAQSIAVGAQQIHQQRLFSDAAGHACHRPQKDLSLNDALQDIVARVLRIGRVIEIGRASCRERV